MKSPRIMFVYAAFLALCGLAAFALAGFESRAKTALIVGMGSAAVIAVCGALARMFLRSRALGMIGIHGGLALSLIFAALFAWRSYGAFDTGGEEKRYLAIILAVMATGSVAAFLAMLATRPPKAARTS